MAKTVDDYIAKLPAAQAKLAQALRKAILSASPDEISEAIKWAQPVFESNGPVCYFKAHKQHVTFGFWRGAALMGLDSRLETSGSKMAHIKLFVADDVDRAHIAALVRAATKLNRVHGDPNRPGHRKNGVGGKRK
jgi:hypothetical protein